MENNNDKSINDFFSNNKKEIKDNGFSAKVLKALPEKKTSHWIIPVASLLGFYISLLFIDIKELFFSINLFIININPLYIAIFFVALPFLLLAAWYANEKQNTVFH